MLKESFLQRITPEHVQALLQERQDGARRCRRALPLIDAKMICYPDWSGTCPKTGMLLTLQDIKEETQAWLEESEEEIEQLRRHLGPEVKQLELGL